MFKILVVEDDKELNRTVCSYLDNNGYTALGALDAEAAFDRMYENTMLDIVDVQTADYDPARSIINRQFDASRPRFFDDKNYDTEIKNGVVQ